MILFLACFSFIITVTTNSCLEWKVWLLHYNICWKDCWCEKWRGVMSPPSGQSEYCTFLIAKSMHCGEETATFFLSTINDHLLKPSQKRCVSFATRFRPIKTNMKNILRNSESFIKITDLMTTWAKRSQNIFLSAMTKAFSSEGWVLTGPQNNQSRHAELGRTGRPVTDSCVLQWERSSWMERRGLQRLRNARCEPSESSRAGINY